MKLNKESIKLGHNKDETHWILEHKNSLFFEKTGKYIGDNIQYYKNRKYHRWKGGLNYNKKFILEILPQTSINGGYRAVLRIMDNKEKDFKQAKFYVYTIFQ